MGDTKDWHLREGAGERGPGFEALTNENKSVRKQWFTRWEPSDFHFRGYAMLHIVKLVASWIMKRRFAIENLMLQYFQGPVEINQRPLLLREVLSEHEHFLK